MPDAQPTRLFAERQHRELVRGLNAIHDLGMSIGHTATPVVSAGAIDILRWLDQTLEPHLAWEDAWLFPEIDRRLGTPWGTRAARFDHGLLRTAGANLRQHRLVLTSDVERGEQLRSDLFGLEALVRAHIEREECLLFPILDEDARAERPETDPHRRAVASSPT
jgi:iron-sulfur cluster repair protein YtfE (RIC family)